MYKPNWLVPQKAPSGVAGVTSSPAPPFFTSVGETHVCEGMFIVSFWLVALRELHCPPHFHLPMQTLCLKVQIRCGLCSWLDDTWFCTNIMYKAESCHTWFNSYVHKISNHKVEYFCLFLVLNKWEIMAIYFGIFFKRSISVIKSNSGKTVWLF